LLLPLGYSFAGFIYKGTPKCPILPSRKVARKNIFYILKIRWLLLSSFLRDRISILGSLPGTSTVVPCLVKPISGRVSPGINLISYLSNNIASRARASYPINLRPGHTRQYRRGADTTKKRSLGTLLTSFHENIIPKGFKVVKNFWIFRKGHGDHSFLDPIYGALRFLGSENKALDSFSYNEKGWVLHPERLL
jgi:hypothetical protein